MDIHEKITHIINSNTLEASIVGLTEIIETEKNCWEAYLERGKLFWKSGEVKKALNDYIEADRQHPNSMASEILEHTMSILRYRNTDILNP